MALRNITSTARKYWGVLIVALFLIGYAAFQATHLQFFMFDTDEGIILMQSKMLALGYPLYTQIWTEHPPLLFAIIATAFKLFGHSAQIGRLVILGHTLIALSAIAILIREIDGDWFGVVGGLALLSIAPSFFGQARAVMRTLPGMAWATLALAFALYYRRTHKRRWLVLSGLSMVTSLLIKLITVPTLGAIGLIILIPRSDETARWRQWWRRVFADGLLLFVVMIVPSLLTLFAFNAPALIESVFARYFGYQQKFTLDWQGNIRATLRYLVKDNFPIFALALIALLPTKVRKNRAAIIPNLRSNWFEIPSALILIVWFCANFTTIILNKPRWQHHSLILLVNLAVFAGLGLTKLKTLLTERRLITNLRGYTYILTFSAALIALGAQRLPEMLRTDWRIAREQPHPEVMHAVELVRGNSAPDDFIVSEFQMIPFYAERLMPPEITNTSEKRILGGDLTGQDMIRYTEEYDAPLVVLWASRIRLLPDYLAWLDCHYPVEHQWKPLQEIRLPREQDIAISHPLHISFGDYAQPQIELLGYAASPHTFVPDALLELTLYWRAVTDVEANYTAFVHIYTSDGQIWSQHDAPPSQPYDTSHWAPSCIVTDKRSWQLPNSIPEGALTVKAGLYHPDTLQRLPAFNSDRTRFPDDSAILTIIQ